MLTFDPTTHSYTIDGQPVPSTTTILKDMGLYGDAAAYFTPEAATRGTYVHRMIAYHIDGCLDDDTVDPDLAGYFAAFKKFQSEADIDTDTWTVEKPLASKVYRFAGTPDFVGLINGKCAVIDLKTSLTVSPAEQLQTAAYHILLTEGGWRGAMPVTHRFSLHVTADGTYKLHPFTDRQDKQVFLSALAVYQWKHNNLRRAV